jgi:hypothetical protein
MCFVQKIRNSPQYYQGHFDALFCWQQTPHYTSLEIMDLLIYYAAVELISQNLYIMKSNSNNF